MILMDGDSWLRMQLKHNKTKILNFKAGFSGFFYPALFMKLILKGK